MVSVTSRGWVVSVTSADRKSNLEVHSVLPVLDGIVYHQPCMGRTCGSIAAMMRMQ